MVTDAPPSDVASPPPAQALLGAVRANNGVLYRIGGGVVSPVGPLPWDRCADSFTLVGRDFQANGFWLCAANALVDRRFYVGNIVGGATAFWSLQRGNVTARGTATRDACETGTLLGRSGDMTDGFWLCMDAPDTARWAASWEFDTTLQGWTPNGAPPISVMSGRVRYTDGGSDPYLVSPTGLNLDASNSLIYIGLRNATPSREARVYFVPFSGTAGFAEARAVSAPTVVNDTSAREYVVDMSTNPEWRGTIRQLRLDPGTAAGPYEIDYIRVGAPSARTLAPLWDFTADNGGWSANNGTLRVAAGVATLSVTGNDASVVQTGLSISAARTKLRLRVRNGLAETAGEVFFATRVAVGFSPERAVPTRPRSTPTRPRSPRTTARSRARSSSSAPWAWWPFDAIVKPDARYVVAFDALRTRAAVVAAVSLALFRLVPPVRRHATVVAPALFVAFVLSIGYSLGALGGPDLTWFADASVALLAVVLLPLRLPARVVVTTTVAVALLGSFFLPFTANLAAPAARAQVAWVVFVLLSSIVSGEVSTRLARRAFFQKLELDRANATLASLTVDLSTRVAEQTMELRSLAIHLERVQESERGRIARDLHDDLGQRLTAMRYTLARVERRVGDRDDDLPELVSDLSALVDGASSAARDFVSELRPRVLDDYGLAAAVEWLCERVRAAGGMPCTLTISKGFPDGTARPDAERALCLFRVAQEATTNALKHAKASALEVTLSADDDRYSVSVRDDGVGFDPKASASGFGLLGLRERVRASGGTLTLDTRAGHGTLVRAEVRAAPLTAEEPS